MMGIDRHRRRVAPVEPELDRVADVLRENQKLITLGRLTASIVHEINNPLESITNLLYLMESDRSENSSEYLMMAQRELARIVQITRQTLTFSRETSTPVRVEPAELIEEVLGLYARRISDKEIRIQRQYASREQVLVLPGEIRQVISNLIANALEASAVQGRIVIRVHEASLWAHQGRQRGLRISIGDDGSGISLEVRRRLGQPFFTTKGQGGTGLGVWVTQAILSRYGSSLRVRSSVGRTRHGSVFSFVLPLELRPVQVLSGGGTAEPLSSGLREVQGCGPRLVSRVQEVIKPDHNDPPDRAESKAHPLRMRACGD